MNGSKRPRSGRSARSARPAALVPNSVIREDRNESPRRVEDRTLAAFNAIDTAVNQSLVDAASIFVILTCRSATPGKIGASIHLCLGASSSFRAGFLPAIELVS